MRGKSILKVNAGDLYGRKWSDSAQRLRTRCDPLTPQAGQAEVRQSLTAGADVGAGRLQVQVPSVCLGLPTELINRGLSTNLKVLASVW